MKIKDIGKWAGALLAAPIVAAGASASARIAPLPAPWHLDRVVVVMRHGVRPPTKPLPLPIDIAGEPWPAWDVGWGELTHHGERAVALLGAFDRAHYLAVVGHGCPAPGAVRVVADSDERTLRTAQVYRAALLPGCTIALEQGAPDTPDPRFAPFEAAPLLTEAEAVAAERSALAAGFPTGLDRAFAPQWHIINRITHCASSGCSIASRPTALTAPRGRAKLAGALGLGASFAQTLALEYADGKPMAEVGWGRATAGDITALSALHAAEFAITARPPAIARAGARALLGEVRGALTQASGPSFSVFVGHDTNIAYLGGALGLHWQVPQFAGDDPPPGGALLFERWSNGAGRYRLRVLFRSQTLDEMRNLARIGGADVTDTGFVKCSEADGCDLTFFSRALGRSAPEANPRPPT